MEVSLHFKTEEITKLPSWRGGSNSHDIPCQAVGYSISKDVPVIRVSFSDADLATSLVNTVVHNRHLFRYADSSQKYVEIPCDELYSASVRTNMR